MNVGGALCGTELSMSLREQTQESLTCDFKSYPIFRPASLSYNKAQWHEVTPINLMEEEKEEEVIRLAWGCYQLDSEKLQKEISKKKKNHWNFPLKYVAIYLSITLKDMW